MDIRLGKNLFLHKKQQMEITVEKNKVYDFAMALTARIGAASDNYLQVAITKDNYPMLDVYLSEAIVGAESFLRKKLAGSNNINMLPEEEEVKIRFKEDLNVDESVHTVIASCRRVYMASVVAASWLLTTPSSSLSETYSAAALSHLKEAYNAITQKQEPYLGEDNYQTRKNDDVIARRGIRISDKEVIFLKSDDGSDLSVPASTYKENILTSK